MLRDRFERETVADFWVPGDCGRGRYEPGAVEVSSEFARTGRFSLRITVREGDIEQVGASGQRIEWTELDSGRHSFLNRNIKYSFSEG